MDGIEGIRTYISWRKNAVAQYISNRPILDIFLDTESRPELRTLARWWEQENLMFPGGQEEGGEGGHGGGDG